MAELRKARLETWKEVAAFFGKDERTVKRWEAERGLPVRRLPGATRSRVYAEVEELQEWLRRGEAASPPPADAGAPAQAAEPQPAPRPSTPPRRLVMAAAAAGLAAVAVVAAGVAWSLLVHREPTATARAAPAQPPSLAAQRLYLAGMDDWNRRTPESLHRAVDELDQAIRLAPDYAEAYVGLADCYNLLREYTLMPASQAYPLARKAARQALALNNRLASAHAALAFVYGYWDWDGPAARREFGRAIQLQPASDLNHHWYANYLAAQGDFPQAMAEFGKAEALNPSSLAIRSDHGLALYQSGRRQEGLAILLETEKADPNYLSPHTYLARAYLAEGRDEDFLRESEVAARLTDDRQGMAVLDAARTGFAGGGHQGLLKAMLGEELRQYQYGAAPAYSVARTFALIGDSNQALDYLQISIERHEENASGMGADPVFAPLRNLPRFRTLAAMTRTPAQAAQSL